MITETNYTDRLLDIVPEFKADYESYLEEMDGEILGHPLMGDLYRFAKRAHDMGNYALFNQVVDFVNEAAQSPDEYIREIVHASFMEHVPSSSIEDEIKPLLNSEAKAMYQAIVTWKPEPDIQLAS